MLRNPITEYSISQKAINYKIAHFLEKYYTHSILSDQFKNNIFSLGFAHLWGYAKSFQMDPEIPPDQFLDQTAINWWHHCTKTIACWDGLQELSSKEKKSIKKFIDLITYFEDHDKNKKSFHEIIANDQRLQTIRKEYSIAFCFTEEELTDTLKQLNKKNRWLILKADSDYLATFIDKNIQYHFYNPNNKLGEEILNSLDQLSKKIFHACHYDSNQPSPLGISFYVSSLGNITHESYPSHQDVLKNLILAKNPQLHKKGYAGNITPLHIAAAIGSIESFNLAKNQFDIEEKAILKRSGKADHMATPLMFAVYAGQENMAVSLIKYGADSACKNNKGHTPLITAIRKKNIKIINALIQAGVSVNQPGKFGISPLMTAVDKKDESLIQYLLEKNATINQIDDNGFSPLMIAHFKKYHAIAQMLIKNGANQHYANSFHTKNQMFIINKLTLFCEKYASYQTWQQFENSVGFCEGFAIIWAYTMWISSQPLRYDSQGQPIPRDDQAWWEKTLNTILSWDGFQPLSSNDIKIIERFINLLTYFQQTNNIHSISTGNLEEIIEDTQGRHPIKEYLLASCFTQEELIPILERLLHKNRFIRIVSFNHATALYVDKKERVHFYDPNNHKGAVTLENINQLSQHIFYANHYHPTIPSPLGLSVFHFATNNRQEKIHYPAQEELLKELSVYKNHYLLRAGYAYDMNPTICAASIDDVKSIQFSLKKYSADQKGWRKYLTENNQTIFSSYSPLLISSQLGQLNTTKELIKQGIKLDNKDSEGMTALMYAASKGYSQIIAELINNNADPNATNNEGLTALMLAIFGNYIDTVKLLLETQKINIDYRYPSTGETALMIAAKLRHMQIVELLIKYGATTHHQQQYLNQEGWRRYLLLFKPLYPINEIKQALTNSVRQRS